MKMKWTLKEDRDGTTWWVIRGGAFSNVINSKYPHRLWDDKDEMDMYCRNMNRRSNRKCEVVEVRYRDGKKY